MKLIDKDALVEEIERRIKILQKNPYENHKTICHLDSLKQSLDTLEVKVVDLEKNSLTWKDINLIDHLLFDIKEDYDNGKLDKEKYYKEVLKKFKAQL